MNEQRFVVSDVLWQRLKSHLPGKVTGPKQILVRDLSIRPVFQLDISEFSTDFHLNQLFAYFTVGYG